MWILVILLMLETRAYHPVTIAQLSTTIWTHVRVCGEVTLVKHEADGDIHIRLTDGPSIAVAEIVPYHPLPKPALHTRICVNGISRRDGDHHWYEVHPVESWELVK